MNLIERRVATEKLPWQDSDVLGTLVTVDGNPTSGIGQRTERSSSPAPTTISA